MVRRIANHYKAIQPKVSQRFASDEGRLGISPQRAVWILEVPVPLTHRSHLRVLYTSLVPRSKLLLLSHRCMICSVELNSSDPVDNSKISTSSDSRLRLLIFLNRYIEQIGRRSDMTNHDAAVLSAIDWVERQPNFWLKQKQMAQVLGVTPAVLSTRVGKLRKNGFCVPLSEQEKSLFGFDDNREEYFRVTPAGNHALEAYSRLMFELPSKVAEGVESSPAYRTVIDRVSEIVQAELTARFLEAHQQ